MTQTVFRFRLERVRAVRERREKLARQELARAIAERSERPGAARGRRGAPRARPRTSAQRRRAAASISSHELIARQAFLERAEEQRGQRARELDFREAEVRARDEQLVTAASEHEMLKRLRERRLGEHEREVARVEGIAIDEIASARNRNGAS